MNKRSNASSRIVIVTIHIIICIATAIGSTM